MTSRKIVVAVDDGDYSRYAVDWALKNFFRPGDTALLLHAAPSMTLDATSVDTSTEYPLCMSEAPGDADERDKSLTNQGVSLINSYIEKLSQAHVPASGEVVKGNAGEWIVQEADRIDADAILMGTHGYGLLKRTIFGSISDHVVHHTPKPVILVRQPHENAPELEHASLSRKIVIAVDGSPASVSAFKWALSNLCTGADNVLILHVQTPATGIDAAANFAMDDIYVPDIPSVEDNVEALRSSEKLVEKYMAYAEAQTKLHCEGMVVSGQMEDKICQELVDLKADAVVLGASDRSVVGRTLLGSVSDYLAHSAPCPVMIIKSANTALAKNPAQDHLHTQ